ncbi:hypothetical protein DL96DRAFT_1010285 [Flagelloscypha sp. PMI_526]|nr:hypothetical protein DL96DRAFT_1010285 [Flagelloscypha sp. PMI_526]
MKFPNLPRFEYPVTQPYPWRWYSATVLFVSFLALIVMTLINYAAVGYEPRVTISPDFRLTEDFWWMRFVPFLKHKGLCEYKGFAAGDIVQTSTDGFTYTVQSAEHRFRNDEYSEGVSDPTTKFEPYKGRGAFLYGAQPLGRFCVEAGPTYPEMPFSVHRPTFASASIEAMAKFRCELPMDKSGSQWRFHLSTKYVFSVSDITDYTNVDGSTNSRLGSTLGGVVDGLADDLMDSVLDMEFNATSIETIVISRSVACDAGASDPCPSQVLKLNETSNPRITFRDGNRSNDLKLLPNSVNTSITNFLVGWASATRADLGGWLPGSIFVTNGMLNQTFAPGGRFANDLRANATKFSSSIPLPAEKGYPNTEISAFYTCHGKKLKSPGNLIVSIIVADLSMFGAFWGVLGFLASHMAKRKDKALNATDTEDGYDSETVGLRSYSAMKSLKYQRVESPELGDHSVH